MIRYIAIVVFTCACFLSKAQVNIITTIAGKTPYGFSGDGGPATNAQLKAPISIFVQDKCIYIVDVLNERIRKIDVSSGIITSIAGNGSAGFSGDGNLATDAQFNVPQSICLDTSGNIYVSDALNYRIRKITTSGIITTIAGNGSAGSNGDGGMATDAKLNAMVGVNTDVYGNVYIADWTSNKVRKVTPSTGIITTVAGTGISGYSGDGGLAVNAKLNHPSEVFTNLSGDIFIAEQSNHVVRKVDAVTGFITTIAGTGSSGYSGDGGLAINAKLDQPTGLYVDKQNNIYIADYGNGTIRRIDAVTGIITTVAGIGTTGFSGDGGPATDAKLFCTDIFVDSYGNLIIADYENNRIRKVNNAVTVSGVTKEIESKLYPNPTKGVFTIQTPVGISLTNIYNIAGVRVYEHTSITNETEIDITSMPSGVYMVYVQCGDKQYLSKVVKE